VLAADWETAAADNISSITFEGDRWIKKVGDFLATRFPGGTDGLGISGGRLNVVGHSWGAYVAQQLGHDLFFSTRTRLNFLIALDPALLGAKVTDDALNNDSMAPLTSRGGLDLSTGRLVDTIYFRWMAQNSWAFYTSQFGNLANALTAQDTFLVLNPLTSFNLAGLMGIFGTEGAAAAGYIGKDNVVAAHNAASEILAKLILHTEENTVNSVAQRISARFQVDSPTISQWVPNLVFCADKNTVPVVRSGSRANPLDYPLEGVLTVDDHYEPILLVPTR
jgi:pimeloyl-ACP methyl ester carboxylesterase